MGVSPKWCLSLNNTITIVVWRKKNSECVLKWKYIFEKCECRGDNISRCSMLQLSLPSFTRIEVKFISKWAKKISSPLHAPVINLITRLLVEVKCALQALPASVTHHRIMQWGTKKHYHSKYDVAAMPRKKVPTKKFILSRVDYFLTTPSSPSW